MNCSVIFFASYVFRSFVGTNMFESDGVVVGNTPAALSPQAGL